MILAGQAPDGTPLLVPVDPGLDDDQLCAATYGTGIMAYCTLPRDHRGRWHVAATTTHIVEVWPVARAGD